MGFRGSSMKNGLQKRPLGFKIPLKRLENRALDAFKKIAG
jgi:hypothetical protein